MAYELILFLYLCMPRSWCIFFFPWQLQGAVTYLAPEGFILAVRYELYMEYGLVCLDKFIKMVYEERESFESVYNGVEHERTN